MKYLVVPTKSYRMFIKGSMWIVTDITYGYVHDVFPTKYGKKMIKYPLYKEVADICLN